MKKSEKRKKSNERQRRFVARQKEKGLVKRTVWLAPGDLDFFRFLMMNDRENFYRFWKYVEGRFGEK